MLNRLLNYLLIVTALAVTSCSAKITHTIEIDPAEPLRIAVLPFAQIASDGSIIEPGSKEADKSIFIDGVPLVSDEIKQSPETTVRNHVSSKLNKSNFDIVPQAVVDAQLQHAGLVKDGLPDVKRIYKLPPSELCRILGCDTLFYGRIPRWSRTFYGLQSVHEVIFDFSIISARSNAKLFTAQGEDSESRGITSGPTGWSSLVLEPIKGLDSSITKGLALELTDKMLEPLFVEKRAKFLDVAAPELFGSTHTADFGVLKSSDTLNVLALGSSKCTMSFSIGQKIKNIPMYEVADGHYVGEYHPLESDSFSMQPIVITIIDRYGRTTEQNVGLGPISLAQTLNVPVAQASKAR